MALLYRKNQCFQKGTKQIRKNPWALISNLIRILGPLFKMPEFAISLFLINFRPRRSDVSSSHGRLSLTLSDVAWSVRLIFPWPLLVDYHPGLRLYPDLRSIAFVPLPGLRSYPDLRSIGAPASFRIGSPRCRWRLLPFLRHRLGFIRSKTSDFATSLISMHFLWPFQIDDDTRPKHRPRPSLHRLLFISKVIGLSRRRVTCLTIARPSRSVIRSDMRRDASVGYSGIRLLGHSQQFLSIACR